MKCYYEMYLGSGKFDYHEWFENKTHEENLKRVAELGDEHF